MVMVSTIGEDQDKDNDGSSDGEELEGFTMMPSTSLLSIFWGGTDDINLSGYAQDDISGLVTYLKGIVTANTEMTAAMKQK